MTDRTRRHPHHHAVQFYGSDDTLVTRVAGFIGEGLQAGQPEMLIATPAHGDAILQALTRRMVDVDEARRAGDLVCLDAEETLAAFMAEEMPDAGAFRKHVGDLIAQTAGGRVETPVRAYGEMVDVLWKGGRTNAAIKLEILWNELAATHAFQLLCGYAIGHFYRQSEYVEEICRQHTHAASDMPLAPVKPRS